jgi:hypothetical protein
MVCIYFSKSLKKYKFIGTLVKFSFTSFLASKKQFKIPITYDGFRMLQINSCIVKFLRK